MSFVANTDNMNQLVDTLGRASQQIDERLDRLRAYGDKLKSTWTGPAGDAYEEQKRNWERASLNMNNMLLQFHTHLNTITGSIVDTERRAQARWQNI